MKALVFSGDRNSCFTYRIDLPFKELKRFGVQSTVILESPTSLDGLSYTQELVNLVFQHDIVIVQRSTNYTLMCIIRNVCDITRKPLVYETDDDYLNIPQSNPAHAAFYSKKSFFAEYKAILGMADAVTVTTKELKQIIYPYNKRIGIFPNNLEYVHSGEWGKPLRRHTIGQIEEDGSTKLNDSLGFVSIPSFREKTVKLNKFDAGSKVRERMIRIGYSATHSHKEDFLTIKRELERVIEKYWENVWFIVIGDKWFKDNIEDKHNTILHIPTINSYQSYMFHLRNLDIGIAPLTPNLFNMSKSPLKALEYATWGTPSVLPNYVTYTREFTDRKNCLTYYNAKEFGNSLEELINNEELRNSLGTAARDHLRDFRLERSHAKERYLFYRDLIKERSNLKKFMPDKEEINGLSEV